MNLFARLHDLRADRHWQVQHQLLDVSQLDQRSAAHQPALFLLGRVLARLFNPRRGQLVLGSATAASGLFAQLIAVQVQPFAVGALSRQHAGLYALSDGGLAHAHQFRET